MSGRTMSIILITAERRNEEHILKNMRKNDLRMCNSCTDELLIIDSIKNMGIYRAVKKTHK